MCKLFSCNICVHEMQMQAHLHLQMRLAAKVDSIWTVSTMLQYLSVSREALAVFPEGKAGGLCWDSVHDRKAPGGNSSNAPSDN